MSGPGDPPTLMPGHTAASLWRRRDDAMASLGLSGLAFIAVFYVVRDPAIRAWLYPLAIPVMVLAAVWFIRLIFRRERAAMQRAKEESAAGYSTLRRGPDYVWLLDDRTGAPVRPPLVPPAVSSTTARADSETQYTDALS